MSDTSNEEIWICDSCYDDNEEGLAVYEIIRVTRTYPNSRYVIFCSSCADRIPHGNVISS